MTSSEAIKKQQDDFAKTYFPSNLDCFSAHKGFRPGEIHTFVGPRGGGKSTVSKTIMADVLECDKKVLIWLSEESPLKYLVPIRKTFLMAQNGSEETVNKKLENMKIISELELDESYRKNFWMSLSYDIDDFCPDVLIYDNFTTGFLSSQSMTEQLKSMHALRRLAVKKNIPVLIFLHSDKTTRPNDRTMSSEDVKGLSTIVNIGSYNYVIHPVVKDDFRVTFLIIDKSRYHHEADKTIWELMFSKSVGIFLKSKKVERNYYNDLFKKQKTKKEF